jgi:PAS domain S-box-containing protein
MILEIPMEIESILYVAYSNTSIIVSIVLALLFWYRRNAPGARRMVLIMLFAAFWCFFDSLSDLSNSIPAKEFWGNLSYLWIALIPVAWLIFTLQFTKSEKYLRYRNLGFLLYIIPAITFLLVLTNDSHHLMISESRFIKTGQFLIWDQTFGWWGWIHATYSYLLLFSGIIHLVKKLTTLPRILRSQVVIILAAILVPVIINILYTFKISPSYPIDPTKFSFTFTGIVCFWGMFRFKLFEMIPAARNAVVEDMSGIMVILDNQNNIIDINTAAKNIFGGSDKDFVGKPIIDILGDRASIFIRYEHVLKVDEKISIDIKDGKKYYDLKITPLFDNKNRLIGRFIILYDISNLEEAINELKESRRSAEDANKAKSQFLAAMSHEIRTPLYGIIGMTELLAPANHTQEEKVYLQSVQSCANSLLDIINDILDFSKIEAGKMELEKTIFNLRNLMDMTVQTFSHQKIEKDIELVSNIDDAIPECLIGDPGRIRQIFVNLIGNAFKFTEKGKIEIRAERLDSENQQVLVRFSVLDTGIGIPEDKISSLFKSFQQIDNSTTRKYGGTGLGLAIVKNLTEMMGGNIQVESKLGIGSRFSFILPLLKSENNVAKIKPDSEVDFQGKDIHILLAEDNKVNQVLMAKILEKKKIRVDIAENGQAALCKLEEKNYDLILMDVQMPVMDGYETTLAIRRNEAVSGKHMPIIALTANATEEDKKKCLETGMDDYLTKPVKSEKLFGCLYKYIVERL